MTTATVAVERQTTAGRKLEHRRALVTGASAGIGADFARELATLGCNLVLVARSHDRLRALATELARDHGVKVDVVAMDLVEPGAAERLHKQVTAAGLDVDVLVNNAGLGLYGAFVDQSPDKIREMLQLNVMALTELTRLFLPQMRARGFGRVVQVGSIASHIPGPLYAAYTASKVYVLSLGESLNQELKGTGVTCTVVCPGMTATSFFDVAGHREDSFYKRLIMMRSRDVARIGIAAALKGRTSVVTGFANKLQVIGSWFISRRLAYLAARLTMKLG